MKSSREILIDMYFEEKLSSQQKIEFDELMSIDPDFYEEVAFQKALKIAIRKEERENVKSYFQSLDESKQPYKNWWYAAVAAVILLCGISWYLLNPTLMRSQEIYLAYFEPYPNVVAPIVREEQKNEIEVLQAFELYEEGKYDAAAIAFEQLYYENGQSYALLYQSISLMASGLPHEAIPLMEQKDWSRDNNYSVIAHWYLALAYLENQEVQKAKIFLQKVADSDHHLAIHAKKISKSLS